MSKQFIDTQGLWQSSESIGFPYITLGIFVFSIMFTYVIAILMDNKGKSKSSEKYDNFLRTLGIISTLTLVFSFFALGLKISEYMSDTPTGNPENFTQSYARVHDWAREQYGIELTDEQSYKIAHAKDGDTFMLDDGRVIEADVVENRYVRLIIDESSR